MRYYTSDQISAHMRRIKKKDTKPEIAVRRLLHGLGYRFRLHRNDLPGTPDIVFPARKKVILVHGCFWHQHACSLGRKQPKTNQLYWGPKLARNVERDREARKALRAMGWQALVVWECQVRKNRVSERITRFLNRDDLR
jgi:DNA mismatch endonuclease, patch repair protein